ncbi:hypothetical protein PPBDW_I21673 [Photobacterium kishitanii]|nr:hypothetical protein PPBDW_I21673 [Photobacterium kishitanii]
MINFQNVFAYLCAANFNVTSETDQCLYHKKQHLNQKTLLKYKICKEPL